MPGVALSRWTMSYFVLALLSLIAAEALMVVGFGYPLAPIADPETLIVVHLVALGWLSLLLSGALFQFVPVLVARRLYSDWLPLPTLACLVAGLGLLLAGFYQLASGAGPSWSLLPYGGTLLAVGFALVTYNLGRTLSSASVLTLPARFVTAGLFSLVATALLGLDFTYVLGGATVWRPLASLAALGVPVHVVAGIGGWLTFAAMGVSYRLLAMFMLAPEREGSTTRGALMVGSAALVFAIVGGVILIWSGASVGWALGAAGVTAIGALSLYGHDIIRIYRERKRRVIELNSRMAAVALAHLFAAVVLGIVLQLLGAFDRHIGTVLFLVIFGWLSGLGLAMLYKITAFLTWLECYGPVLGRVATPRVQDLVVEQRAVRWFILYFVAVDAAVVALLVAEPTAARLGVAAMLFATVAISAELVRIRRLVDVESSTRLPEGARRPGLMVSFAENA